MDGAQKKVDGALDEKGMGNLVESYVWKLKVTEFRKDKGRYLLYLCTMIV
jgi:hypothetical protein